jgi:uncharacterized delta-60 repeat protein
MSFNLMIRMLGLVLVGSTVFLPAALAAAGDLDTTFNSTGFVRESVSRNGLDEITGTVLQADGKIVAVGNVVYGDYSICAIARYNPDGSLDTSFDGDGKVIASNSRIESCYGVALQSDGKIVIAGYVRNNLNADFEVNRYNLNGSPDLTFGVGGKAVADFSSANDFAYALAIQADDKIVVAGRTTVQTDDFAVVRFTANGSLDLTFDGDGKVTTDVSGNVDHARAVTIQPDGKILVGGNGSNGTTNDFAVVRLLPNGALDTSFDGDGKALTDILGSHDNVNALAVQADGKIVAAGQSLTSNVWKFSLVRYNPNGSLDGTFDNDGKLTAPVGSFNNYAYTVAIQADGKIVAAGSGSTSTTFLAVVRYNPDGSLDSTFDGDGIMTTAAPGVPIAIALAIQADGKIITGGTGSNSDGSIQGFAVARFNPSGAFDTSFDGDGRTTDAIGSRSSMARATAIQPDGKIVVAGSGQLASYDDFAIVRYNPNGSLDTSFGVGGKVLTDFLNYYEAAFSVAIQPDGKILVGGNASGGAALARYNPNGSLDASFDGDGKLTVNGVFNFTTVAVQSDGKILAGGYGSEQGISNDFALFRYNSNGSPDPTFDGDGKVYTDFSGQFDGIVSIAIQPDGKIVAAGSSNDGSTDNFALVRYNPDGSLDPAFDGDGRVMTVYPGNNSVASFVAIQPDGRIVAAGGSYHDSNGSFALVRYNADGSPDPMFDGDGKLTTPVVGSSSVAASVALQADGKIVAAGFGANGLNDDFALVRYNPDGSLDGSYGSGGKAVFDLFYTDEIFGMTLDSLGRAVVAGRSGGLFTVARFLGDAASAANVSVAGRVARADGRGVFNGFLTLTDSAGNTHITQTNPFGYYRFNNVPGGPTTIGVSSKIYTFANPTRTVTLTSDISGIDFTAIE